MPFDPYEGLNENLPFDVMPASNGEFYPPPPTPQQIKIMALANEKTEEVRHKLRMSRRSFVRTGMAMAIGLWAADVVNGGKFGNYALAGPLGPDPTAEDLCAMEFPNVQLNNLPGEFIFDLQSHHVMSDGLWRVAKPVSHAFIGGFFGALSNGGSEVDPVANLSRPHYIKELLLDSATTMTVLSPVPNAPDIVQPLPFLEAVQTAGIVKQLAGGTERTVVHSYVMPNRGSTIVNNSRTPALYLQEELDIMMDRAMSHPHFLRGWKVYSPYSDVPYGPGFLHNDEIGLAMLEQIVKITQLTNGQVPPCLASHKGPQLPGFDANSNACHDVGPAARQYPGVNFIIYHAGAGGGTSAPYPGDDQVVDNVASVNSLIKSLRINGLDAESHVPAGLQHGNSPNVYAEIGSTWRGVASNPSNASHLLGKLIKHVGAQRVVWGTDCLWYGSPQPEIVALRSLQMTDVAKETYNLPYGLDGDRFDPTKNAMDAASYMSPHPHVAGWPVDAKPHPERTIRNGIFGRNAAPAYRVEPDVFLDKIKCDDVVALRNQYYVNEYTSLEAAPGRTNMLNGPRTREQADKLRLKEGWVP